MSNLKEIKLNNDDVKKAIEDFRSHDLGACCLIGLSRGGRPILVTSNCSGFEKTFMANALNSFVIEKFGMGETETI